MDERNPGIGFIGAGVLGKGLALALVDKGYRVVGVHSRSASSAQWVADRVPGCRVLPNAQELADAADLVFITTPDSVIGQVAAAVSWRTGQGVAHCSGADSTEILNAASDQGAATSAFHPFQTFAGLSDPADATARLAGVTFAVAGNGWPFEFLRHLAGELGGLAVSISDTDRPLYHAAGVIACGHLLALLYSAVEIWQVLGFSQEQAVGSLYPICHATLDAMAKDGVSASATGPIYRGDIATVRAHFEAIFQNLPHLAPVYGTLAAASLPLAAERGVALNHISAMQELIDHYTTFQ